MINKLPDVIIADDHDIFREGIVALLTQKKIARVVAEANTGIELLKILKYTPCDLLILDIAMPKMDGVEAANRIQREYPHINTIVLSMFGDEAYYYKMIQAGVKGFVLKSAGKDELIEAIAKVVKGSTYFSNELLQNILMKVQQHKNTPPSYISSELTQREYEVLTCFCNGLSAAEVADKLFLSVKTVEGYRTKLFKKTGTKNSIALIIHAIKNHLVDI